MHSNITLYVQCLSYTFKLHYKLKLTKVRMINLRLLRQSRFRPLLLDMARLLKETIPKRINASFDILNNSVYLESVDSDVFHYAMGI